MDTDLAAFAAITPEGRGLEEQADEWCLATVAIPKSARVATWTPRRPSYRRGWTFALAETTTFAIVPFVRTSGAAGVAVVIDEPSGRHPVTWFAIERADEARRAVDQLNTEVRALWEHWRRVRPTAATATGASPRALRFEEGHEHAPDARWGLQVLILDEGGDYSYEQRRAGRVVRRGAGNVGHDRVAAILADLARSTFPAVPKRPLSPGATTLTISLGEQRASIGRWHGAELDGYREAIDALLAIVDEARKAAEPSEEGPPR